MTDTLPQLTLRTPADILTAVSHALGYEPSDALATVALSGRRAVFVACDQLPEDRDEHADFLDLVHSRSAVARHRDGTAVMLVGYGPARRVTPAIDLARAAFDAAGLPVWQALRVTDGRYFSHTCTDPACCPIDGRVYNPTEVSVLRTEAVVAGLHALPSRADLAATLAPRPDRQRAIRQALPAANRHLRERLAAAGTDGAAARAVRRYAVYTVADAAERYRHSGHLDDPQAATVLLLVSHPSICEDILIRADTERTPLWTDLARRAPDHLAAAPATLLAHTLILAGRGPLAAIAADRALAADPDHGLARAVHDTTRLAVHPEVVRGWIADLRAHDDLDT